MKAQLIITCEAGEAIFSRIVSELQNVGLSFCFVLVLDGETNDATAFV